ncbi:MAG: TfoX/Sxy family DNA transformation protein [Christensenellaceae bacterium]|nr:TfoX/Sxy family DNA transformation protein [Christensenellaceae bacterium]
MSSLASMGFGKTMERKLLSVGIRSAEELRQMGSRQAAFRLKEQYPNTCVVILYYLEAAIQGVEISRLNDACKAELKAYFRQL